MVTKNYALSSDSLQIVYSFGVTGMGPVSLLSFKMRRSFVMLHPFAVAISGFCALGCAAIERCEENQLPSYWRAWWWSAHWSRSRHSNQPDDQLQSPFWFYFPIFVTFLLLSVVHLLGMLVPFWSTWTIYMMKYVILIFQFDVLCGIFGLTSANMGLTVHESSRKRNRKVKYTHIFTVQTGQQMLCSIFK